MVSGPFKVNPSCTKHTTCTSCATLHSLLAGILSEWRHGYCRSHCINTMTRRQCFLEREHLRVIYINPVPWEWERDATLQCYTSSMPAWLIKTSESGDTLARVVFIEFITHCVASPHFVQGQCYAVLHVTQKQARSEGVPIVSTPWRGVSFPFSGNWVIYMTLRHFQESVQKLE